MIKYSLLRLQTFLQKQWSKLWIMSSALDIKYANECIKERLLKETYWNTALYILLSFFFYSLSLYHWND